MFYFQNFSDIQKKSDTDIKKNSRQNTDTANWVDEYGDYLYGIALLRVGGDTQTAEDIVQDTFIAALKALDSFEGKSTERTWLVSILKRKIIDFYRKNKRFVYLDQDGEVEALPDFEHTGKQKGTWKPEYSPENWHENPVDLIEKREFQEVLRKCIGNLPKNLEAVFTIREIDGWTTEDICKEFKISPSNLWVMLHRARTQLRRCLEKLWFIK
jgi:RNA polymerase sigma-70 factor (ECF subfamily)